MKQCLICGKPVEGLMKGMRPTMHEERVINDCVATVKNGKTLSKKQRCRLYAKGYTLTEFYAITDSKEKQRKCEQCGKMFTPNRQEKVCSELCAKLRKNKQNLERYHRNKGEIKYSTCKYCGKSTGHVYSHAHVDCLLEHCLNVLKSGGSLDFETYRLAYARGYTIKKLMRMIDKEKNNGRSNNRTEKGKERTKAAERTQSTVQSC